MDAFLLVRHARTRLDPSLPSKDWPLADDTTEACRKLAGKMNSPVPTLIVASTEAKAIATGRTLADALAIPCHAAEGLEEHDRTGVPFITDDAAWHETIRALFETPDRLVLGKETALEALDRFETALRRELDTHGAETLAVVSHATVISLFVAKHNSLSAYDFWRTLLMPDALVLCRSDFALAKRYSTG